MSYKGVKRDPSDDEISPKFLVKISTIRIPNSHCFCNILTETYVFSKSERNQVIFAHEKSHKTLVNTQILESSANTTSPRNQRFQTSTSCPEANFSVFLSADTKRWFPRDIFNENTQANLVRYRFFKLFQICIFITNFRYFLGLKNFD